MQTFVVALLLTGGWLTAANTSSDFRFVIMGDRTGGHQAGVWDEAWREAAADHPAFYFTVGDTIEGGDDHTVDREWQQVLKQLAPYRHSQIFFTPGNHDVWSPVSAEAYEKYSGHPLHYSFDYQQAHFTVLDDSRSDAMPHDELAFLEADLRTHASQPVKFVISHRPSWIVQAVLQNPNFPLERLAKKYGVKYVIAGHIHELLHYQVNGTTYLCIASSGGHLRNAKRYEDGWFFQHTLVTVHGDQADFTFKEVAPPLGKGRVTHLADWGPAGLIARGSAQ